jgi:hypothetical protein
MIKILNNNGPELHQNYKKMSHLHKNLTLYLVTALVDTYVLCMYARKTFNKSDEDTKN